MIEVQEKIKQYFSQQQELYPGDYYLTNDNPALHPDIESKQLSLATLKKDVEFCQKCDLCNVRENTVFGEGNENADLMLIGDLPCSEDDKVGKPFNGEAGELLDKILKAINLNRNQLYVTNVLKCKTPDNKNPHVAEKDACKFFLEQQIELIKPKLIVCLGKTAGQILLKTEEKLQNMRKKIWQYKDIDVIVTYHPAALLHNQSFKKPTWVDFQKIEKLYKEISGE